MELLFLLGFSVHNLEEALWLPAWSKHAGRFHAPVRPRSFVIAVSSVTLMGILLTAQFLLFGDAIVCSKFVYLGFVSMMVLNAFFPHLAATLVLHRYAPGTLTGLMLNVPLGVYIVRAHMGGDERWGILVLSTVLVSGFTLVLIHLLFRIGTAR